LGTSGRCGYPRANRPALPAIQLAFSLASASCQVGVNWIEVPHLLAPSRNNEVLPPDSAQPIGRSRQGPSVREERMLDTIREKTKMIHRARRIRGQVEAIERALEQEMNCSDMLRLIASARGAINGLMAEVLEDYIRTQVVDPSQEMDAAHALAAEELIEVVQCYLK
jgi:DNA-binding FrmR family transcriptional regulator